MAGLKLRLVFGAVRIGPGEAELMEHIRETGWVSAAGGRMKMRCKRAWMLVEEMNAAFAVPLVASTRGGPGGGGASLTEAGAEVLRRYRAIEAAAEVAAAPHVAAIAALLSSGDIPEQK